MMRHQHARRDVMGEVVSVIPNVNRETFAHRKRKPKGRQLCSKCCGPRDGKGRYCLACHAAYMREWRKAHPMTEVQKFKDRARSYANVYKKRGKLAQCPCENCGSPRSEMHHENYNNPLDVIWLCRPCHVTLHKQAKRKREYEEGLAAVEQTAKPSEAA